MSKKSSRTVFEYTTICEERGRNKIIYVFVYGFTGIIYIKLNIKTHIYIFHLQGIHGKDSDKYRFLVTDCTAELNA